MKLTLCAFLAAVLFYINSQMLFAQIPEKNGTEKIDALVKLAVSYRNSEPQKALENARRALKLSEDIKYQKGKADSYANIGEIYMNLSDFNSALQYHQKAFDIRKASGDKTGMALSLNSLGEAMEHMGSYDVAMEYFFQAIKIEEEISDLQELSSSYSLVATLYYILKDYPKTIEYCSKALMIREKTGDKEGLENSYELMGLVNYDMRKLDDALKYHTLALKAKISSGNRLGVAGSYQNLGLVYKLIPKYDLALHYFHESMKIKEELGDKRGIAASITAIGETYEKQGKDQVALKKLLQAFKIRQEIRDKRGMARSYLLIGELYKKMGNYKNALDYQTLYYKYKDSLNNAQSLEKLTALNLQYKSEKKDKEIAILQKDSVIQKTIRNSLIGGVIFVTVIAILIFSAYRSKQKTNSLLEEKNHEISGHHEELEKLNNELKLSNASKDRFFSILAHDLRSPFTGFLGLSEEMAKNSDDMTKEEISEFATMLNQSAKRIYELLNNLLEWSLLQSRRLKPEPVETGIWAQTENIINLFSSSAMGKSISVINKTDPGLSASADKNMVETILRNLISNAIKFTGEGGQITVSSEAADDELIRVTVSDTGVGIKEDRIGKIFDTDSSYSTRGTGGETGSGLGLSLCKELVEINGGKISISSTPGKGTSIAFTLPAFMSVEVTG